MPPVSVLPNVREFNKALIDFLVDFEGNFFVTFVYNRPIGYDIAITKVERFQAIVDRKILGSQWLKRRLLRTQFLALAENTSSNLHFHVLFKIPNEIPRFLERADAIWDKLMPSGDLDIQEIYNAEDLAEYMSKQMHPGRSYRLWPSPNASKCPQ